MLINHGEHSDLATITRAILNKIIRPHMITMLWTQSNAGTIVEPQSGSFWLFLGDFQTLTPPYTEDTFVINVPTISAQQCSDPFVTVPPIFCGEPDDCSSQCILIIKLFRSTPLGRTMLFQNPASAAL